MTEKTKKAKDEVGHESNGEAPVVVKEAKTFTMDDLDRVMVNAYPTVNWFALGEAKAAAKEIALSVNDYRKDKTNSDNRRRVIEAAKVAAAFLSYRATTEANQHSGAIREVLVGLKET